MNARCVIRIVGLADGNPCDIEGLYVKEFDAEAFNGGGDLLATDDIENAKIFDNATDALEAYTRISTVKPMRADGQPNRPMTAFTVEIATIPKE